MAFGANPVFGRELRDRARAWQTGAIITLWIAAVGGAVLIFYRGWSQRGAGTFTGSGIELTSPAEVGRGMFEWLVFLMIVVVLFLIPGVTSAAIAGEHERKTLVPLQMTGLGPFSIVFGKLGASLSFVLLLLLMAAPLVAVPYLIGGMTIGEVAGSIGFAAATAVMLACTSLACSAMAKRTQVATVASYAVMVLLVAGTFVAHAGFALVRSSPGDDREAPAWLLLPNPMAALADVIGDPLADSEFDTPFDSMALAMNPTASTPSSNQNPQNVFFDGRFGGIGFEGDFAVDQFGQPIDDVGQQVEDRADFRAEPEPFWRWSLITMTAISLASLLLAMVRMRKIRPRA